MKQSIKKYFRSDIFTWPLSACENTSTDIVLYRHTGVGAVTSVYALFNYLGLLLCYDCGVQIPGTNHSAYMHLFEQANDDIEHESDLVLLDQIYKNGVDPTT